MKRILLALLGLGMVAALASSAMAATPSLYWDIKVAIAGDAIDLHRAATDTGAIDWGTLSAASNNFSNREQGTPRMTLWNMGYATIDYSVAVSCTASTWTFATPAQGLGANTVDDRCVLAGIFCAAQNPGENGDPDYEHSLTIGDFSNDDIISSDVLAPTFADNATPGVLHRAGELTQFLAYNVPSGGENASTRSLRLLLQTPPATSPHPSTVIYVILGARVSS